MIIVKILYINFMDKNIKIIYYNMGNFQANNSPSYQYNQDEQNLDLQGCTKSWKKVLKSRNWQNLKSLNLFSCLVDDDSINILCKMKWPQLLKLDFNRNRISGQGIKKFCQSQWPKIQSLVLSSNENVQDHGLEIIVGKFHNQLKLLDLRSCGITSKGIKDMSQYQFINLTSLQLSYNKIGNSAIKWLVKSCIPNLTHLYIINCEINGEGFKCLIKNNWRELRNIFLTLYDGQNNTTIQLDGWKVFYNNNWKKLEKIFVQEKQSILYLQIVLAEQVGIKKVGFNIENEQLKSTVMNILNNRNALKP